MTVYFNINQNVLEKLINNNFKDISSENLGNEIIIVDLDKKTFEVTDKFCQKYIIEKGVPLANNIDILLKENPMDLN